jgi:hypothetical protein
VNEQLESSLKNLYKHQQKELVEQTTLQMAQLAVIATEVSKLRDLTVRQETAIEINNANYAHIGLTVSDRLDDVLL